MAYQKQSYEKSEDISSSTKYKDYFIDKNTICQYSEQEDSYGTPIFEKDLVRVNGVIYNANGKDYSSYLGNKVRIIIDKYKKYYKKLKENKYNYNINLK